MAAGTAEHVLPSTPVVRCPALTLAASCGPRPNADEIAAEISNEFLLSDTDRDICAAALKEWLDRGMDQQQQAQAQGRNWHSSGN